ncbi:MAG: hypothetical protein Q9220_003591 [cf. Caloplaca sp. 1 TL-2023]
MLYSACNIENDYSILYIGVYIGEAVSGQIAVAFTRTHTPWNVALIAIGIVGIVLALLIRLFIREPPPHSPSLPLLILSASFRQLAGNVFGYYMPSYLLLLYPRHPSLLSRYGIIVGVVGSISVLLGGLLTTIFWHRTPLLPLYLTGIGGMVSSLFVLLMINSKAIAHGDEDRGVKVLYGSMSLAYLTAELWLGAMNMLIALLMPPRVKTFGLAVWSAVQVLIYSSGPEIVGLALRGQESGSAGYAPQELQQ